MVGELLCPDCGGVVGATETTEAGPPCRCFAGEPESSALSSRMDETAMGETAVAEPPKPKICRICGKDVAGHRRVKDSAGYMCYDCAKAEEKRELGDRVKCNVCGHLAKETSIQTYEGTRMCSKCYDDRMDLQKKHIRDIGVHDARTRADLSQLNKFLIVAGVLLVIILLSVWRINSGHHH
jgi:DNA-directed RNA polymerase subunit RPC12/RpoP